MISTQFSKQQIVQNFQPVKLENIKDQSFKNIVREFSDYFKNESKLLEKLDNLDQGIVTHFFKPNQNKKPNAQKLPNQPLTQLRMSQDLEKQDWQYLEDNIIKGLFSTTQMDQLFQDGKINAFTKICYNQNFKFYPLQQFYQFQMNKKQGYGQYQNQFQFRNQNQDESIRSLNDLSQNILLQNNVQPQSQTKQVEQIKDQENKIDDEFQPVIKDKKKKQQPKQEQPKQEQPKQEQKQKQEQPKQEQKQAKTQKPQQVQKQIDLHQDDQQESFIPIQKKNKKNKAQQANIQVFQQETQSIPQNFQNDIKQHLKQQQQTMQKEEDQEQPVQQDDWQQVKTIKQQKKSKKNKNTQQQVVFNQTPSVFEQIQIEQEQQKLKQIEQQKIIEQQLKIQQEAEELIKQELLEIEKQQQAEEQKKQEEVQEFPSLDMTNDIGKKKNKQIHQIKQAEQYQKETQVKQKKKKFQIQGNWNLNEDVSD